MAEELTHGNPLPDEEEPILGRPSMLDASAVEVARTTELISVLSREVAELARQHDHGKSQLDELVRQVSYLRLVLDYSLFVTPDRTCNDGELYPVLLWLRDQFEQLGSAVDQRLAEAPEPVKAISDEQLRAIERRLAGLQERVEPALESLQIRSVDILRQIAVLDEQQREELERLGIQLSQQLAQHADEAGAERIETIENRLGDCLTFLQDDVLGSLESLKVRMVDALRSLAALEETGRAQAAALEARSSVAADDSVEAEAREEERLLFVYEELRSVQQELTELKGLFESFNVRLIDQARYLATSEAKQKEHFDALRKLVTEHRRPTFAGLRDTINSGDGGRSDQLLQGLKGSLDSIHLQLAQHTRQFAFAETQLRSQYSALQELISGGAADGDTRAAHESVRNSVELVNLRLLDAMRFLTKVEEQQRQQIGYLRALHEARAQVPQAPPQEEVAAAIEQSTARLGAQQHLYYGLLVLLCLVNMGLICWLKLSQ